MPSRTPTGGPGSPVGPTCRQGARHTRPASPGPATSGSISRKARGAARPGARDPMREDRIDAFLPDPPDPPCRARRCQAGPAWGQRLLHWVGPGGVKPGVNRGLRRPPVLAPSPSFRSPHTLPLRVVAEFLAAASPLLLLLYRLVAARRSSSSSSSSTAWWPRAAPPSVWVARARRLSSSLVSNPRRIPLSREPVWCPA